MPFENLGRDVYMSCYPAMLEIQKGTDRIPGGKTCWLKTNAEDWTCWVRGKRLAEMEITMPELEWRTMQAIAERLEVPPDALVRAGLDSRLKKLRQFYKERGMTLGTAATTGKGGAK
jgi:hypothetical protein